MPWFRIDDRAHSHPKWLAAGNAAIGLFVRAGSYSAQHLTEGVIPAAVAKLYGTPAQAAKLIKVGLWHGSPHDCPRCPQAPAGDFIVHDFFEGGRNTTKAQDEANRKGAAERAAKSRAARNASRSAENSQPKTSPFADENNPNGEQNEPLFLGSTAGQDTLSHRTPADGAALAHATTTPYPPLSFGERGPTTTERAAAYPERLTDLKQAIAAAGISGIDWQLRPSQWEYARQAVERVGIPAMVAYAANSVRLKGTPSGASAWIKGWSSLEAPPENGVTYLPAVPGPPSKHQAGRNLLDQLSDQLRTGETA
jgi:hypothetical protein